MRERLNELELIGGGRWGDGDLVFGSHGDTPDEDRSHAPVFAFGVIEFPRQRVTVTVHDEIDGQIEVQIAPRFAPNGVDEIRRWTLAYWTPGLRGPESGDEVREIEIDDASMVLAICPAEKRIWLHERERIFNRILPATAMYNQLMQHLKIRDRDRVLSPQRLFSDHAIFSDIDFIHALRRYGEQAGRFTIPDVTQARPERRFSLRRLFGGSSRHV